jgi:O-succinylhomoserine sulfhydrylase
LAIRAQNERAEREHSVPLFLTSSFVFEDAEQARALFADEMPGNIYTRFSNPNANEFVQKMCLLEGAEDGIATASGMSAVYTSMAGLLRAGDHILASRALFGSSVQILTQIMPRFGIEFTYIDGLDAASWSAALRPTTKMMFVETPSNPGLDLIDLAAAGRFCAEHQLILNVDNCFATPVIQTPIAYGAHIVTHSATKWIDGQGRGVGGVIVGRKDLIKELRFFARHTGPAMSPFNAWMFSKSLETLAVRMRAHCANALELATRLEAHPEVEWVKYPHLPSHPQHALAKEQMSLGGGIVSFAVKGGIERGRAFLNSLKLISHTANLGDTRTIATHPASTTHSKLSEADRVAVGIHPGMIRISVGLEHIEDVWADVSQALA